MKQRWLISVAVFASGPAVGFAGLLLPFDPQRNTWNATHIVVVEGEKVVESWAGDLKPGDRLPEGAAGFARIPVPADDPIRKAERQKLPLVSGKRKILFLTFIPRGKEGSKTSAWTGADWRWTERVGPRPTAVAWVEGEMAYAVYQPVNPGGYAIGEYEPVAALKQQVEVGLALKAQFAAARAEKDTARRAARVVALAPFVSNFAGNYGEVDVIEALGGCGAAAVPYLTRWATGPHTRYSELALPALCRLGPVGLDEVMKVLDEEVSHWKDVAAKLKPGQMVDEPVEVKYAPWRGPSHLVHVLDAVRRMQLSDADRERVRSHAGLRELARLLASKPGMRPEHSDMVRAQQLLYEILAGRFPPAD
jgi:hypothetical protein